MTEKKKRGRKLYIPTPAEYQLVAELMEAETPVTEIVKHLPVGYAAMKRAFRMLDNYKPRRTRHDHERHCDMCDMYRSGKTYQVIGDKYQVSRARIQQILSKYGITAQDGGLHVVALDKKKAHRLKINANTRERALRIYGVSVAEHDAIKERIGSVNMERYQQLKAHVLKGYGVFKKNSFEITLAQFVNFWESKGLKVNQKGYCFARINHSKGYVMDNMHIVTDFEQGRRVGTEYGFIAHPENTGRKKV